jgi:uncharacterized glyoxalase superfamily protein PhnB
MITPVLRVRDVDLSLRFYTQLLGFKGEGGLPGADGKTVYAEAYMGDAKLMISRRTSTAHCIGELYIDREVPMCEDLREEIWGDCAFTITDLDGNRLTFAQRVRRAALSAAEPLAFQHIA